MNTRHPLGWTALHVAAINGKSEALKFLISKGADVNAGDEFINVFKTAMEKGLHTLDGKYVIFFYYIFRLLYSKYKIKDWFKLLII